MVHDRFRRAEIGLLLSLNDALFDAGVINERIYGSMNKIQKAKLTQFYGSDKMDFEEKAE